MKLPFRILEPGRVAQIRREESTPIRNKLESLKF